MEDLTTWAVLERSWGSWAPLRVLLGGLGRSWGGLGRSWGGLGAILGRFDRLWGVEKNVFVLEIVVREQNRCFWQR